MIAAGAGSSERGHREHRGPWGAQGVPSPGTHTHTHTKGGFTKPETHSLPQRPWIYFLPTAKWKRKTTLGLWWKSGFLERRKQSKLAVLQEKPKYMTSNSKLPFRRVRVTLGPSPGCVWD